MPKAIDSMYVHVSLGKRTCLSLAVVTARPAHILTFSAWQAIIASGPVQAAPVAGSSHLTALWLWWAWRSGRVAAIIFFRALVLGLVPPTPLIWRGGKCCKHVGRH